MKILQIIKTAYRATIEEQDDTVVWLTHAMKGAGGDLSVLLQGNAVNYVVDAQDSAGLSFGGWTQSQPPKLARDIKGFIDKGVAVFVIDEDFRELGLENATTIKGIQRIPRSDRAVFFENYELIWQW